MAAKGTSDINMSAEHDAPQQENSALRKNKEREGITEKKENEKEEERKKEEGQKEEERKVKFRITVADPEEYACHGLGKGIDATAVHPWESRSPYEARAVIPSDIVMLYEGMRVHQYKEQIDSYYDIQGSIETSLKIPNKPIEMGVAADASRSSWFSKVVRGKKVLICTIAFDRKTQLGMETQKSKFELDFEKWLVDKESVRIHNQSKVAGEDPEEEVKQCISAIKDRVKKQIRETVKQNFEKENPPSNSCDNEVRKAQLEARQKEELQKSLEPRQEEELAKLGKQFLLSLGRITHYISSITLGAMEYTQSKSSSKKMSYSQSTTIGVERVTNSKAKASTSKSVDKVSRNTEKLGRFQYDQKGMITDYVRDQEEAVVHYAFTPLSSLVNRQDLFQAVKQAIQDYTNEQLSTHSGPYLISCTEPMDGHTLYWKIERERECCRFIIKPTPKYNKASKFYIELDRSIAGGFFFITTTDGPTESAEEKNRPEIKRYIHMEHPKWIPYFRSSNITLAAYATVVHDSVWTTARFQVIDHQSHRKRTLEQSDWLPDKGRIDKSQPCFLTPYLHSNCLAVVRERNLITIRCQQQQQHTEQGPNYEFRINSLNHHREGKCHMLFTLTQPPSDYGQLSSSTVAHASANS